MHRLLLLLLSCVVAAVASAAELQAEAAVITSVGLSKNWEGQLYTRGRVITSSNRWFDVTTVPTFQYRAPHSIALSGGVFITRFDYQQTGGTMVYRPFGEVEPKLKRDNFAIDTRFRFERFFITKGLPDANRYRQRFRITGNGKWRPYSYVELFFSASGFAQTRYSAGVRRDFRNHTGIEISYLYEARQWAGPGIRHMIRTTLHLNFKGLAPD